MNKTAFEIMMDLKLPVTKKNLVDQLLRKYEITEQHAAEEVEKVLSELRKNELLID